jgi:hypothetical protein
MEAGGFEPPKENSKPIDNKGLMESTNGSLCASLCKAMQKDTENAVVNPAENPAIAPELEAIITAWPNLPEHIRQEIKALIESCKGK